MSERFFHPETFKLSSIIFLDPSEEHHLRKVMRIRVGQEIELINGKGEIARASVEKEGLQILNVNNIAPERGIFLGLPFMRPSKLELVLEKGMEIGVASFFLFPAEKSTIKTISIHHIKRFNGILISALKQSKRAYLPNLEILSSLEEILAKDSPCLFGDMRDNAESVSFEKTSPIFITGPEGGFSRDELALLDRKAKGVRINKNVLRAETAPLVASSLFAYQSLL